MLSRNISTPIAAPFNTAQRLERVPVLIFDQPKQLSRQVARRVANLIEAKAAGGEYAVLGLPTGSTPIGVYQELIRMHKEDDLDFSNVITFNLDEYFPMQPDSIQSYHLFMHENFFNHVNILKENIYIPDGTLKHEEVEAYCSEYERKIKRFGGLDIIMLGIGRSGHVGFNEPGSEMEDRTRLIVLDEITRKDAAGDFFDEKHVPREAITMGVGTILEAREIILMATGEHKAGIIQRAVEEKPTGDVSATFMQLHSNATFYLDKAASGGLTRMSTPWLVSQVDWDDKLAKRALIWLCKKLGKAIFSLEESDFHRYHLHGLVHAYGGVDALCRKIFEDLRRRITYPDQLFKKKSTIVFSPHPDDDVISMGGMLGKIAENKNDVIVAYMTNGSVAVFDEDVRRQLRFVEMSKDIFFNDGEEKEALLKKRIAPIHKALDKKKPGAIDTPEIQKIKAYIRYTEAIAGIEVMGLEAESARFLDMPFYHTGEVKKNPIGEADIEIVLNLFRETKPEHIFVAGDLSDPHGTHRMCYTAIREAVIRYNEEITPKSNGSADAEGAKKKKVTRTAPQPTIWLYRGAWQEWDIDDADVFLPLSKSDMAQKIEAIYKHESQKDRALFPGAYDEREFWERARDRNRGTAESLDRLGLPQFHAVESYVTVKEMP